jgi:hypothetical protein
MEPSRAPWHRCIFVGSILGRKKNRRIDLMDTEACGERGPSEPEAQAKEKALTGRWPSLALQASIVKRE